MNTRSKIEKLRVATDQLQKEKGLKTPIEYQQGDRTPSDAHHLYHAYLSLCNVSHGYPEYIWDVQIPFANEIAAKAGFELVYGNREQSQTKIMEVV